MPQVADIRRGINMLSETEAADESSARQAFLEAYGAFSEMHPAGAQWKRATLSDLQPTPRHRGAVFEEYVELRHGGPSTCVTTWGINLLYN